MFRKIGLYIICGLLAAPTVFADPDLPGAAATLESIPAGSLIIPMDTVHQLLNDAQPENFNIAAYGLANKMLQNNIPLKWAMRSNKVKIAGTTTGANNSTSLIDTTKNFVTLGVQVGDLVTNISKTPMTRSRVSAVAATTLTVTVIDALDFDLGNSYVVDSADFTATAERIRPGVLVAAASLSFTSAPFIVSNDNPANVAKALEIMTGVSDGILPVLPQFNANAAQTAVRVYRTTTVTNNVDVRYNLTHKPFAAVSDVNDDIHTDILAEAGIPGAAACAPLPGAPGFNPNVCNWNVISPVELSSIECATIHLEPHRDDELAGQTPTQLTTAVQNFVNGGGNFVAQCHSIEYFENKNVSVPPNLAGGGTFMTSNGAADNGANGAQQYPNAPMAFNQITGPLDGAQGGSISRWTLNGGTYNKNNAFINSQNQGASSTTHRSATAKVTTGGNIGGLVFYLGGHKYDGAGELEQINGRRMVLNAMFVPPDRPANCGLTINASLILLKRIVNDGGGTAVVGDFGITTSAGTPVFGSGTSDGASTLAYTSNPLTVLAGNSYSLAELNLATYDEGTWACTSDFGDNTGGGSFANGSVTLQPGDTKTCTITNNDTPAQLIIAKRVINDNGGAATVGTFGITSTAGALVFDGGVADGANTVKYTSQTLQIAANAPFTLVENDVVGYIEGAWTCAGGNNVGGGSFGSGSVSVAPGVTKTCTITNNDAAPLLTLRKVVVNDGGGVSTANQWTLTATGTGGFSGTPTGGDLDASLGPNAVTAGVTYALSESGPAGYAASDWSCNDGNQDGANITLALGDNVTCTITNNDIAPLLTLRKLVVNDNGGVNSATEWTLTAAGNGGFSGTPTGGALDASLGPNSVTAGVQYALSELGPQGYTASAWSCNGGSQNGSNITLSLNQNVICTITNDDTAPQLIIRKRIINDDSGSAVVGDFGISTSAGALSFGAGVPDGANTLLHTATAILVSANTPYSLSENNVVNYNEGAWVCSGGDGQGGGPFDNGTVTFSALGETKTCTITNNDGAPSIDLSKTVDSVTEGPSGTFTVVYNVGAINNGDAASVYDITDTFTPGTGVTLQGGTATIAYFSGPGVSGTVTTPFASGDKPVDVASIAAGATDNWKVTAVFVVDPATATLDSLDCDDFRNPQVATGTTNSVQGLAEAQDLDNNRACAPLPQINLAKSVFSITEDPAGTFTVVYNVTAANNGQADGIYDIDDTFTPGTGVTLQGGTATIVLNSGGGTGGTINTPFANSGKAVDDRMLGTGQTDTWRVTAVFVIDPTQATADSLDCADFANPQTATGTANGVLGSGTDLDPTDNRACAPLPQINLAKNVFSINEGPAGTFTVVYTVTATNNGTGAGSYDIDDTFTPGTGVTLQGGTATIAYNSGNGPSGTVTSPFTNGGKAVDNANLAVGATDTWRVTAVFTVDPTQASLLSLDCTDFTNPQIATATANGVMGSGTDVDLTDNRACAPLPQIDLAKSVFSIIEGPAGTYTVVYNVTATNNGGGAGTYDIDDTFTPGIGVILVDGNATISLFSGGGTGGTITSPFTSGGKAVDDRGLAAGLTDTWRVTAEFNLDPSLVTVNSLECDDFNDPQNLTATANGVLGSGTDIDLTNNRACAPLPQINLAKSVFSAQEDQNGNFVVVYEVTATNNGDVTGVYDINDTFTPGTGITLTGGTATIAYFSGPGVSGTVISPFTNGALVVSDATLAPGQADIWRITATFDVDLAQATTTLDALNCDGFADPTISTGTANGVSGSATDLDTTDNRACAPLPQIELAKTVASLTEGPVGTYTLVYTVTATNNGEMSGIYHIDDTFTPGAGLTLQNGGTATIALDSGGGSGGTISTPFSSGARAVMNRALPAGQTDTWTVTAVFLLDIGQTTPGSLDCDDFVNPQTSTGSANGVLGSSTDIDLDNNRACAPIPQLNLAKTVVSTTNTGGDNWQVVYLVAASNNGGADTVYNLMDTFSPGNGITLTSAELTSYNPGTENNQSGTINIGAPLPQSFGNGSQMVTGEGLVAGLNESWTITANFSVNSDQTDDTRACSTANNGVGTGFHNFIEGSSTDLNLSDNHACSEPDSGGEDRATFTVQKQFMDGNDATDVTFRIDCNTGLILDQVKTTQIIPGPLLSAENFEVEFVVTDFDQGELTCEVWEDPVVPGYTPSYDCDSNTLATCDSGEPSDLDEFYQGPCIFSNVDTSEIGEDAWQHLCMIRNYPDPVPVVVNKDWIIEGMGGDYIDPWYKLTLTCENEIVTTGAVDNENGTWSIMFINETGTADAQYTAYVIPDWDGGTSCSVYESQQDQAVEVSNGCQNLLAQLADGDECTITNTVFFEGIPTLNQYGIALLALLMLGMGLVSFRRFA